MKRLSILMMSIAMLAFASCSTLQQVASSNSVAAASGQSCAVATNALYKTYKSTGKIELTDLSNVTNILTVVTSYNQLKAHKNDAAYRKAFASGAVAAGTGVITSANADTFTNTLMNASGLDGVTASNIKQKTQTAATIISLFGALK